MSDKYYLHSDDNYYWTPEGWAEYQAAIRERDEARAEIERIRTTWQAEELKNAKDWAKVMRAKLAPDSVIADLTRELTAARARSARLVEAINKHIVDFGCSCQTLEMANGNFENFQCIFHRALAEYDSLQSTVNHQPPTPTESRSIKVYGGRIGFIDDRWRFEEVRKFDGPPETWCTHTAQLSNIELLSSTIQYIPNCTCGASVKSNGDCSNCGAPASRQEAGDK